MTMPNAAWIASEASDGATIARRVRARRLMVREDGAVGAVEGEGRSSRLDADWELAGRGVTMGKSYGVGQA